MKSEVNAKVNLVEAAERLTEYWSPKTVGQLNGQLIKVVKIKGDIIFHTHANEDEMFLVLRGSIVIETSQESVKLHEGECYIVPRGIEHRPVAQEEALIALFEPASTVRLGDQEEGE